MLVVTQVKRGDVQDVLYDLLRELKEDIRTMTLKIDRIEIQTTKTNGRVTVLEEKTSSSAQVLAIEHEENWKIKEFIAKYGLQLGTLIVSVCAIYLAIK